MATKSTARKSTTKKTASRSSGSRSVSAKSSCTVKECLEDHPVLRFHATILTALSLIVCLLVAVLIISLTN